MIYNIYINISFLLPNKILQIHFINYCVILHLIYKHYLLNFVKFFISCISHSSVTIYPIIMDYNAKILQET